MGYSSVRDNQFKSVLLWKRSKKDISRGPCGIWRYAYLEYKDYHAIE